MNRDLDLVSKVMGMGSQCQYPGMSQVLDFAERFDAIRGVQRLRLSISESSNDDSCENGKSKRIRY